MKAKQTRTFLPLRHIAAAAIPIALTACTLEPAYQRPDQPVPNAWPTGPAYAQGTGNAGQGRAPAQAQTQTPAAELGWEDFFTDPRLRQLIELALANNRDLRMATLAIDQARAQYRIQRAAQFPSINANAGMVASRVPGSLRAPGQPSVLHAYTAGVGFNAFELDVFGRVRSLKHEALEQYLAVQEVRRSAQISLVAEVASAYLTLQADKELLKISQETLDIQQAAVQMVERSKRAGGMAQIDMHRAQTQLETARVGVEQYTRQVAQDENALTVLIGTQLPADLPPAQPFENTSFVAELPAGLPSALLEQRPDIMAAEHQLKAANADIGAARAAFFPSISLTAAIGVASAALSGLFTSGMAWAFAPSITMPIFNGGANQARLDASRVQKDINVAAYEKTIQQAFREVADGLAARGTYDREAAAQESLAREISETRRLSEMRFRNGVDDYFPVFDAQRQLYSAQQTLVTIRLARLTSRVDLYKALGGGWSQRTATAQASPAQAATPAGQTAGRSASAGTASR
ncbi:efflux transporter outer membrane subunit [Cupriavidus sp. WKF15]|uniref:efflux transporter outer membrane subunit n=1 Tax=Cupriavidus sp. WKF15 TaxID=3032282 RepID=UPI0023E2391C|nr:efflux transporter outer membrane subunit [Cupriavidus sp. WKF15]WER49486.1 efflux transporter outer membrane subunit [Cupriavidus sp. WKF15]